MPLLILLLLLCIVVIAVAGVIAVIAVAGVIAVIAAFTANVTVVSHNCYCRHCEKILLLLLLPTWLLRPSLMAFLIKIVVCLMIIHKIAVVTDLFKREPLQ